MEEIKYDVFISYSRKDYFDKQNNVIPGNEISKILQALTDAGISYWIDKEGIGYGDYFREKIMQNIKASRIFLFLSTYNSNNTDWTAIETTYASKLGKCIIPIRIDNSVYSDEIIPSIVLLDPIKYYEEPEQKRRDLIDTIREQLVIIKIKEEEYIKIEIEEKNKRIKELQNLINQLTSEIDSLNEEKIAINNRIEEIDISVKHNTEEVNQFKIKQKEFKKLQELSLSPDKREQIKHDVYICFSKKDYIDEEKKEILNNEISKIIQALCDADISFEMDRGDDDDPLSKRIIQNIKTSRIFLFLSTQNSNYNSRKTLEEIAVALEFKKYILPLKVDGSNYSGKIEFRLQHINFISYHLNPELGCTDMINTIKKQLILLKEKETKQHEEEEKKRQHDFIECQQQIENKQKEINSISDEIEKLKTEKSNLKESIKNTDKIIKEKNQLKDEKAHQLNMLTNGPTPSPIPFLDIDRYLSKWNWGGIFWGCIWGLKNRLYKISIAIIILEIIFIALSYKKITFLLLAIVPFVAIRIYFGLKGNLLAWKSRTPEMTFEKFRSIQQKWCLASLILLAIIILILLIALIVI